MHRGNLRKLGVSARYEKKKKKRIFSRVGLGMREGVGEDLRHGIGYVDIQVGS